MLISSFFTKDNIPQSGLIPSILIIDMSNGNTVISTSMTEVNHGFYKYDFTTYDNSKDYSILCDGGISLSDEERYQVSGNVNNTLPSEILNEVVDATYTFNDVLKIIFSVLASKSSGGGTNTIVFRDSIDSKNRITATVDTSGNRTAITLNP